LHGALLYLNEVVFSHIVSKVWVSKVRVSRVWPAWQMIRLTLKRKHAIRIFRRRFIFELIITQMIHKLLLFATFIFTCVVFVPGEVASAQGNPGSTSKSNAGSDLIATRRPLVLLSDFGLTERFVASMKGVAVGVAADLVVHDLTHQIEPYNIWQASYMLAGTIEFWPQGTVFVSVVDPGVGTSRRSVVARTGSGHYIVTPDNGSLTLVADKQGIQAVRQIDESVNRRLGSEQSHTFHGRDVYAYTGARLAAGVIEFEDVGPLMTEGIVRQAYQEARQIGPNALIGNIRHKEMPFGNLVTNIPRSMMDVLALLPGQGHQVLVEISNAGTTVYSEVIPYVPSFGYVEIGEPLLYSDSLQVIGLAVNSGSFSERFNIGAGPDWSIRISTAPQEK
jgi:S-adenosylmethionine hydrolase